MKLHKYWTKLTINAKSARTSNTPSAISYGTGILPSISSTTANNRQTAVPFSRWVNSKSATGSHNHATIRRTKSPSNRQIPTETFINNWKTLKNQHQTNLAGRIRHVSCARSPTATTTSCNAVRSMGGSGLCGESLPSLASRKPVLGFRNRSVHGFRWKFAPTCL